MTESIRHKRLWIALAGGASFMLTGLAVFVTVIVAATVSSDIPVDVGEGKGIAYVHDDVTVFQYARAYKIHRDTTAEISRTLGCKVNNTTLTYDAPGLKRRYTKGTHGADVVRTVVFHEPLPVGTKCQMITTIVWYPPWSIASKSVILSPTTFLVQAAGGSQLWQ